jgi:hypothetical protein
LKIPDGTRYNQQDDSAGTQINSIFDEIPQMETGFGINEKRQSLSRLP